MMGLTTRKYFHQAVDNLYNNINKQHRNKIIRISAR